MGKLMISLSDEVEKMVRKEVDEKFLGRVGGLSIFFEQLVRSHFNGVNGRRTGKRKAVGPNGR